MTHPADKLRSLGFEDRGYGEYAAVRGGQKVIVQVDQVNAGMDYADEEPFWQAEIFFEGEFGQVQDRTVLESSSERGALQAAYDWANRWMGDRVMR